MLLANQLGNLFFEKYIKNVINIVSKINNIIDTYLNN